MRLQGHDEIKPVTEKRDTDDGKTTRESEVRKPQDGGPKSDKPKR